MSSSKVGERKRRERRCGREKGGGGKRPKGEGGKRPKGEGENWERAAVCDVWKLRGKRERKSIYIRKGFLRVYARGGCYVWLAGRSEEMDGNIRLTRTYLFFVYVLFLRQRERKNRNKKKKEILSSC